MRFLVGVLTIALTNGLEAQTVRGQVTDSVSRTPLAGAFLTLVDSIGSERARAITDAAGQFTLTAPEPGTYRLRSKRIGFRPYFSPALALHSGETMWYSAAIDPIPIALREVVVAGERQCDVEAGASVAALWEEVREALAAVAWTSRSPAYWYQISHFDRELDARGKRRIRDSTWIETGFQQIPFRSAPASDLVARGYVVVEDDGTWTYQAPDADVLLSDPFLRTHCFETKAGHGETAGFVGLAFTPARDRSLPDVAGTLWLDQQTSELRHLEFNYTRLPHQLNEARAGGRVEFMRVPTGAWIVRDWVIRMPLARITRTPVAQDPVPIVVGFLEHGGSALEIKTQRGTVVYRADGRADTLALAAAQPAPLAPAPPAAPAPPPPPPPPPVVTPVPDTGRRHAMVRDHNVLTAEEFQGTTATDALGLVQHYRPNWLHYRGPVSILNTAAGILQVYVDGSHLGDWNRLHEISARDVQEMRFYSGPDATMRHGVGNAGGAIEIQTR